MTEDEIHDKVIQIIAEGGYQSIVWFVRKIDGETLQDIFNFDKNDE